MSQRGIGDIVRLHTCSRAVAVALGRLEVKEQDVCGCLKAAGRKQTAENAEQGQPKRVIAREGLMYVLQVA